jgi:hypothetical protein
VGSELESRHAAIGPVGAMPSRRSRRIATVTSAIIAGGGLLVTSFLLGSHTRPVSPKTADCARPAASQPAPATEQPAVPPPIDPQPLAGALDSTPEDNEVDGSPAGSPGVNVAAPNNPTPNGPPNDPALNATSPANPPGPGAPLPGGGIPNSPLPRDPTLNTPAPDSPPPLASSRGEQAPRSSQTDSSWRGRSVDEPPVSDRGGPPREGPWHRSNPARRHYRPGEERDRSEGPLHRAVSGLGGL